MSVLQADSELLFLNWAEKRNVLTISSKWLEKLCSVIMNLGGDMNHKKREETGLKERPKFQSLRPVGVLVSKFGLQSKGGVIAER